MTARIGDLRALCEAASTLYHRLVLVVGPARSGKTRLLQATAADAGWPLINLNQRVSELLLELTQRQRALRVPRLVGDVLAETGDSVVLVDNLELLFSTDLAQDPLRLLQGLARNRTVVASWPGVIVGRQLTYAEPMAVTWGRRAGVSNGGGLATSIGPGDGRRRRPGPRRSAMSHLHLDGSTVTSLAPGGNREQSPGPFGAAFERHYRIGELAEMWKLGRETVRLLVKDEDGVIKVRLGRKKAQTAYSVPESVAKRIHTRLLNSR